MAADVSGLTVAILDAAPTICEEAAEAMGRDIQASAPVGETGELSREWETSTQPSGNGAVSTLRFTAEHASYQDEGTDAHEIVGNPLLAFEWGGQTVIVHSVQHPGSHKNDGFFSDKAGDESLWALQVQAVLSSTVIA
jgi:hypothetical protein